MKTKTFTLLLTLLIIIMIGGHEFSSRNRHNKQIAATEKLTEAIQKRNHLDALYWDHLEGCSYINKDSASVDKRGYLRVNLPK